MTRQPFDEFSKQLFEALLTPYGRVTIDRTVPGEARRIDIYFEPDDSVQLDPNELGQLAQLSTSKSLFEPFRNPPTATDIRSCVSKLYFLHAELDRAAEQTLPDSEQPQLWILASSVSDRVLNDFGGKLQEEDGIYLFDRGWRTGLINIAELRSTEETLWLRLLGKGTTQEQAIEELLMLPENTPKRSTALDLLARWNLSIKVTETLDAEEKRFLMALSKAYLEWERQTLATGRRQGIEQGIERGKAELILMQLRSRFSLPEPLELQIQQLPIAQLDQLAIALLNLSTIAELEQWLAEPR
ncbi:MULTISPECIES: DUF4351 domain-containing protein [Leptolyngbya]|jgi:hypothetical protein|uniref:DUF4351 domain-containing protein n=1 Tax=Leptolyngbya boryana NIES-2135 TaxID=1973484 RepID=A0A1Z4JJC3_LEPBY|nr:MULTISPECIES: DUF4351 domain-containing protein [Leptolyngbya]BAY56657.1 hypothetical protein NIES2135_34920 [Leptolyngbya boryana NIES-2135]MBD2369507.1 DUF4351 domain-containing protein [Leptolyngbya sp. FACHB-161]MBD2377387.1 DUF4351 domain-containing protein [Leptolyngbya sp. FACHB-238]MBD2401795.1 DUF4351 domain-containing protein [Leptolyngbya sp. FACHB-239]MBD2408263.1 DUF4351 domain-containing protein [Leptolyngbya sp. FACHB-402]